MEQKEPQSAWRNVDPLNPGEVPPPADQVEQTNRSLIDDAFANPKAGLPESRDHNPYVTDSFEGHLASLDRTTDYQRSAFDLEDDGVFGGGLPFPVIAFVMVAGALVTFFVVNGVDVPSTGENAGALVPVEESLSDQAQSAL